MNVIIIFIGVLCFTVQYGTGLEVYCEGREAVLRFSFPRRDINVTLQIGSRHPFYSNHGGNGQLVESGLSKDRIKRFQVKQFVTDSHYTLILNISNVSREDEGTYISLVYVAGEMITDLTRRIALVIEYPPGNPHCQYVSPSNIDVIHNTWDIIECTAAIGTMPGYIVCFQNNEILPIHGNLVKNSTTLSQRIWVKKDNSFSCCSTDFRGVVNVTSCTAFQMGKVEGRPTTTSATYDKHSSLSYVHHEMSTPFSKYNTTSSIFDNAKHSSTYKIFFPEALILAGAFLGLLILMLVFTKLRKMERGIIPENVLADLKHFLELRKTTKQAHPDEIETGINTNHSAYRAQKGILPINNSDNEQSTRQEQRNNINQKMEVIQQLVTRTLREMANDMKQAYRCGTPEIKLRRQRTPVEHQSVTRIAEDTLKGVETSV